MMRLPATQTMEHVAKDVVTFLAWTADPKNDERKRFALKTFPILVILTGLSYYMMRFVRSTQKTQKFVFTPRKI